MAIYQFAFIDRSRVPDRDAWQAAIVRCGFELELDVGWKPFEHSGFLPCKLPGVECSDSGFELDYDTVFEFAARQRDGHNARQILDLAQGRNISMQFRRGSNFLDYPCVMIACYALAMEFESIISIECERIIEPGDILRIARETLEQAQSGDYEVVHNPLR